MTFNTLWLQGFSSRLCGRRAVSAAEKLGKMAEELSDLARLARPFIPASLLAKEPKGRDRIFTPGLTFWAFLSQVLTRGSSCRETVRQVQSWRAKQKRGIPDAGTSAYCQARKRLSLDLLRKAHARVEAWIAQRSEARELWCGHRVRVIDGCGVSMPDTKANRKRFPYAGGQKEGCGFPTGQMVGLFCLATGRLIHFALASWKTHEIPLARQLMGWLHKDEVLLGDRNFCGFGFMALLQGQGVHVVVRLHARRKAKGRTMLWLKPQLTNRSWTKALWRKLPQELKIRLVRFRVEVPGFRTHHVVLVTTLLDQQRYPDSKIAELYRKRWQVELCFRQIKTTLGLDVLRCQSPQLVEKEVWMHAIAYNLVRAIMLEAALTHQVPLERMSFKGTVDTLRQWLPILEHFPAARRSDWLLQIAADQVPDRPNRSEPRAKKRRPKVYQLLTKPRHQMVVSLSRDLS
jgi:hypothetical protein